MKKLLLSAFSLLLFSNTYSQNWANDIAPILYNNCTKCHNPNGIAPFSLIGYQNAYDHKDRIHTMTMMKMMPPWPPDPNYRHLAYERVLTQKQIDDIMYWVNAGGPSGDTTQAPPAPVYNSSVTITNPDLIAKIPTYTIQATNGGDTYRCFVIPTTLSANEFITEMEVLPNRSAVHHILIFEDTTNVPAQNDAADPGPGYTNFGGTGSNASKLIGAWVPGQGPIKMPSGMGVLLHKNTNIILQIHYPAKSVGMVDSSEVRIKLSTASLRQVTIDPLLNHIPSFFGNGATLDDGPLYIPANTTKTFHAHFNVPALPFSLLSVGPHMHLIGKSIKSWAITPTNDTIPMINIPNWDFMWQGSYAFQRLQKIPANSVLYSEAFYDNTSANPNNPNNPPKDVQLGEETTDEMMLIYFAYTLYYPGDENIILDSTLTNADDYSFKGTIATAQLYDPYPNPATTSITAEYYLPENVSTVFSIYDLKGSLVQQVDASSHYAGLNKATIDVSKVASGQYILQLKSGEFVREKKFMIE